MTFGEGGTLSSGREAAYKRGTAYVHLLASRVAGFDTINLALGFVFLFTSVFYVWTAATSQPITFHNGSVDRYNLLASAFLHLHLWIGHASAALLHLPNPYDSQRNALIIHGPTDATNEGDDILYHGYLYFLWGPAPALVLLVPMHLLGFEPSASVTVSAFAIAGLGFALATLRVLLRQIGSRSLWMSVLAGFAVAFSSAMPFLLRTPSVTEDTLAGGYCFTMAGVWLAMSAIASRQASLIRLVLMSLCFGLAAGSRPPLAVSALVLVPVYMSLRSSQAPRRLLLALACPVGLCGLLLLAYNQARFGQPLEFGFRYQLSGNFARTAPTGHLGYVLPGAWLYAATLPQFSIAFPFILLAAPVLSFPKDLAPPEITGGLLPMAPIVVFLIALPWLWRRRPARLGQLAMPLMVLAAVGVALVLIPAYQFFASTERYEVEFSTLFVLCGVAAWLALSMESHGYRRRLLRAGGGLLAVWGCFAGWTISFLGYGNTFPVEHPNAWSTLESLGSPLSTAIAASVGHPVLADATARNSAPSPSAGIIVGGHNAALFMRVGEAASITIVSPDRRRTILAAEVEQGHELNPAFPQVEVEINGSGNATHDYRLPPRGGETLFPIELDRGVNVLTLSPLLTTSQEAVPNLPALILSHISISAG